MGSSVCCMLYTLGAAKICRFNWVIKYPGWFIHLTVAVLKIRLGPDRPSL